MARFNRLDIPHTWETYWSKYPQGYTILEALIDWVNQVNVMSDNLYQIDIRLDDFINTYDIGVRASVEAVIQEWQTSGLLDDILAGAVDTRIVEVQESATQRGYNVKDYGVKGDGATDDYPALKTLLDLLYTEGGGAIFFPAGTYQISEGLVIPSNTVLYGVGAESYIYLTNASTLLGVAIATAGSNIQIRDIRVGFSGDSGQPLEGTQIGGIGASTFVFSNAVAGDFAIRQDVSDITIRNITHTGRYAVQAEPDNLHRMSRVTYENIHAPNGMIAVTPNGPHSIQGFNGTNLTCGYLRVGAGAMGSDGINLTNITARHIRIAESLVNLANAIVDCTDPLNVYYVYNLYNYGLYVTGSQIHLSNVTVIGNKLDKIKYGIYLNNADVWFDNVTAKNFVTNNVYTQTATPCKYTNCDFTDTSNTLSAIVGSSVNTKTNTLAIAALYQLDVPTSHTLTNGTNFGVASGSFPTTFKRQGNTAKISAFLAYSGTDMKLETFVLKTADAVIIPAANRLMTATAYTHNTYAPVLVFLQMSTTGELSLHPNLNTMVLTGYNRLVINDSYQIL